MCRRMLVALVCSAATLPAAVTSAAPPPADPVVAAGADGAYAVAVPGLAGRPALAGDSVSFAVEDTARERLFSIASASADGSWRSLYTPPRRRPGTAWTLEASATRVVALRNRPGRIPVCTVGGECSPSSDELIGGSPQGPLTRLFGATERLRPKGSCRRRIAQLGADGSSEDFSVSGERIAYARRVRCMSPRRRGRPQVVVRDLRTGAVRVVRRTAARGVQLAGDYLAFERFGRRRDGTVVVVDRDSGRVAYRAKVQSWYSLGDDGVLAVALFPRCCFRAGRLAWYSPDSPRRHRLANRVAVFSGSPLAYAAGRIAYVRRYDHGGGAALAVTDLQGREQIHASFTAPEQLAAFDFDGVRLAFAHKLYRPDGGRRDDGLASICVGDRILVQSRAPIVEVHPITIPGRIPEAQLPAAAPYRSPAAERPECPYRD